MAGEESLLARDVRIESKNYKSEILVIYICGIRRPRDCESRTAGSVELEWILDREPKNAMYNAPRSESRKLFLETFQRPFYISFCRRELLEEQL